MTACGTPPPNTRLETALVSNGGFEQGLVGWGTGYIEDSVRKYHAPEESLLPYWVSPSAQATASRLFLATTGCHTGKCARIEHVTEKKAQHYGTLAQRITVKPDTLYELDVWTRSEGPNPDWFVTAVREWEPHVNLPATGVWAVTRLPFTTLKDQTQAEIRFVIQAPGTYWIDDVVLYELVRR
jgi:hypothetical protein